MSEHDPSEDKSRENMRRDSETFRMLGGFLSLLAFIVVMATFLQEPGHARVVNLGAGLVLFSIGGSMFAWGVVLKRRLR